MNKIKTEIQRCIVTCPKCSKESLASYRITEGVPVIKVVYELTPKSHWIMTDCCCCWSDEKKTTRYSFMADVPYDGEGEIEFINSVKYPPSDDNEE